MREIEAGPFTKSTEPNEVFKYTRDGKHHYILVALCKSCNGHSFCTGCVFRQDSGHPLGSAICAGNGLYCSNRIFKPVDSLLEGL